MKAPRDRVSFEKMTYHGHLDELVDEAWLYLMVHDSKVIFDEDWGYSIVDPWGSWGLCPSSWGFHRAQEVGAIFLYLYLRGLSPPMAQELAQAYIRDEIERAKYVRDEIEKLKQAKKKR